MEGCRGMRSSHSGRKSDNTIQARKRLSTRSLALARRDHEEERAERLAHFRLALGEFEEMSDVEKGIVRSCWETMDVTDLVRQESPKRSPRPLLANSVTVKDVPSPALKQAISSGASVPELADSLPAEMATSVIVKIASFVDNVSELVENYRKNVKPYQGGPKKISQDVTEAIDHVRDLEEFSDTLENQAVSSEEAEKTSLIDEKLQEIVPTNHFTESPTQTALTIEEGKVIQAFLRSAVALPSAPSDSRDEAVIMQTVKDQLDAVISRSPEVKDIYDRALSQPTKIDHDDCKELLAKMGVPVLEAIAPYEAEGLASSLAKAGLVDFVGTEDSDVLAYEVCSRSTHTSLP